MQNLVWKIILILAILGLCVYAIIPPSETIRLGKDLRGGVSLVYHVNIDPRDPNPQATVTQVITVLKERVNPKGCIEMSRMPLGLTRSLSTVITCATVPCLSGSLGSSRT